ncbi:MAG TPA: hypothetical protein VFB22_07450 [Candidatus Baltobacteraceae bacterium]|nr:hypothetical protein [Candidatus Baltobacteraceae bacterium]
MKDSRYAEIAWLAVIAVLIAVGGLPILDMLRRERTLGVAVSVIAIAGTLLMMRRAYDPSAPTARADVTKAVAYCATAVLALVTIVWHPHWGARACITAAEVAVMFDIVLVARRPRATPER